MHWIFLPNAETYQQKGVFDYDMTIRIWKKTNTKPCHIIYITNLSNQLSNFSKNWEMQGDKSKFHEVWGLIFTGFLWF